VRDAGDRGHEHGDSRDIIHECGERARDQHDDHDEWYLTPAEQRVHTFADRVRHAGHLQRAAYNEDRKHGDDGCGGKA
jgi:hypothetical protein